MAQCHKICLFLEHRVTFAMIYFKFNNYKRIISYSLWKGHGEMKISPWKKITFADIFGMERRTHFKFPTIKENTKTRVEQKSRLGVLVYTSYLRCFNCTHVLNVLSLPYHHASQPMRVGNRKFLIAHVDSREALSLSTVSASFC